MSYLLLTQQISLQVTIKAEGFLSVIDIPIIRNAVIWGDDPNAENADDELEAPAAAPAPPDTAAVEAAAADVLEMAAVAALTTVTLVTATLTVVPTVVPVPADMILLLLNIDEHIPVVGFRV
jgi:hypothetical protein